jgi:hypothetical protein
VNTWRAPYPRTLCIAALGAVLVASACVSAATPFGPDTSAIASAASTPLASASPLAQPPQPTADITPAPTPSPGDCLVITYDADPLQLSTSAVATISSLVIEGDYVGVAGPAIWNTPDGHRPSTAETYSGARPGLYTPLDIENVVSLRGKFSSILHVLVPGGSSGCDTEIYSNPLYSPPVVGQRYAFFISPALNSSGAVTPNGLLRRAWSASANGAVQTPEGPMTLADLNVTLQQNPYAP